MRGPDLRVAYHQAAFGDGMNDPVDPMNDLILPRHQHSSRYQVSSLKA
jgi:hypothetical protein